MRDCESVKLHSVLETERINQTEKGEPFFYIENGPFSRPLFRLFCLFKQSIQFLQQINVKIVHPVHGAAIRTYDLWNMSLLSKPLDQVFL